MRSITELRGKHAGEDIWVLAAGPSAEYVEPEFFNGKVLVGVNRVWVKFDPDYVVIKEGQVVTQAALAGWPIIASKYHCGANNYALNEAPGEVYIFEHEHNHLEKVDLDVIGTDKIVVSYSTITSALHVAAYMGAANIILVGHDCGFLDGQRNFEDYPEPIATTPGFYEQFLEKIEPQTLAVKQRLWEVYGCRTYSLNPFINFGLEGHTYERSLS